MARCPKCRCTFRVMEDEDPRDFGCPRCGYGDRPEYETEPTPDEDEAVEAEQWR